MITNSQLTPISIGEHISSTNVKNVALGIDELQKLFGTFTQVARKTDTRYFVGGIFKDDNRGVSGDSESLIRTIATIDIDNNDIGKKPIYNWNAMLEAVHNHFKQYRFILYSTYSSTKEHCKLRIILFLSNPIAKRHYKRFIENLIGGIPIIDAIDIPSSTTPNKCFFLPSYSDTNHPQYYYYQDGNVINTDSYIPREAEIIPINRNIKTSDDNVLLIPRYQPTYIKKLLEYYDVSNTSYNDWLNVGMAIHHNFFGYHEGLQLWLEWSIGDTRYTKDKIIEEVNYKYNSFSYEKDSAITMASIRYRVEESSLIAAIAFLDEYSSVSTISRVIKRAIKADNAKDLVESIRLKGLLKDKEFDRLVKQVKIELARDTPPDKDIYSYNEKLPISCFPNLSDNNKPLSTEANLEALLKYYGINVRYNLINKEPEIYIKYDVEYLQNIGVCFTDDGRLSTDNADTTQWATVLSLASINNLPKTELLSFMCSIVDKRPYNPIKEWIIKTPWDGISRRKQFYNTLKSENTMKELLLEKWMLSIIAAHFTQYGFFSKGVLVLQGKQSIGKSSWIKKLLPQELSKYIGEGHHLDTACKDSVKAAVSKAIVELAEMGSSVKKQEDRFKAFISSSIDEMRLPYSIKYSKYKRSTIFAGTINDGEFIGDMTGSVRYWVIPVSNTDYQHNIDMQQLYAEYLHMYEQGAIWYLTKDEEILLENNNNTFKYSNSYVEAIKSIFDFQSAERPLRMYTKNVMKLIGYDKPDNKQAREVGKALRSLGIDKTRDDNWILPNYIKTDEF